ncbi:MAG: hypothetical protein QOE07_40 [Acidimicrobiaceae bacterium]|jgi:hypothetical protein|nr:hypothetical protein [Acidimicrobiaceae bacterium]MDQ1416191.1 hypothetical protein [Acidimicrobiaceae bacterium]
MAWPPPTVTASAVLAAVAAIIREGNTPLARRFPPAAPLRRTKGPLTSGGDIREDIREDA